MLKMEKENQIDPVDHSGKPGGDDEKKDVVDYNSFKKALDEKKRTQDQLSSVMDELNQFKEADLKRKGKTDELLSAKDKRIAELESELGKTRKTYTWSTLTGEIEREAEKAGCKNPKKLIKLMSDDDLKELSKHIGEDFKIADDALKKVIDKNKQENHFLFESTTKKIVNGNPKNPELDSDKVGDLSKLSLDELKALHKKTYK
jgi:hypothetical protein